MAKQVTQLETTMVGNDNNSTNSGINSNNLYIKKTEMDVSNDNYSNGMGIAKANTLKGFENVPGSEASEQAMLKEREIARYNELASKAMGRNIVITNAGIELDAFGGAYGEQARVQPAPLEQQSHRPNSQE